MSWKTIEPKEFIALERDEYPADIWCIYCELFCGKPANTVEVIHVYINKIDYFEDVD